MISYNHTPNEDKKRAINLIYPIIYQLAKNPEQYRRANRLYLELQPEIIKYTENRGNIKELCESFFRVIKMSNKHKNILKKADKLKEILETHTPN